KLAGSGAMVSRGEHATLVPGPRWGSVDIPGIGRGYHYGRFRLWHRNAHAVWTTGRARYSRLLRRLAAPRGDATLLPLSATRGSDRTRRTRGRDIAPRLLRAGCGVACVGGGLRWYRALCDRGRVAGLAPKAYGLPAELSGKLALSQLQPRRCDPA